MYGLRVGIIDVDVSVCVRFNDEENPTLHSKYGGHHSVEIDPGCEYNTNLK